MSLLVSACATKQSRYSMLGDPFPPKPENYNVQIFLDDELPQRPFSRISRLDVHFEKTHLIDSSFLNEALPELEKQAKLSGADAIIEVRGVNFSVGETKIFHVSAIGIRYTNAQNNSESAVTTLSLESPSQPSDQSEAALINLSTDVPRRIALVIGNSNYRNLPRLNNPYNDAQLIASTLKELQFELVGDGALLDLNRFEFEESIKTFSQIIHGGDEIRPFPGSTMGRGIVALFYYAGHGIQARGENYLIPVDANPTKEGDLDFHTVNVNLMLRQMESAETALNLVILDACRNNPFGGRGFRSSGNGLAEISAPAGTLIAFATQSGNIAQDGPQGGNSPFAQALAWGLKQPDLDQFGTFNAVAVQVKKLTSGAQQPWMSNSPIENRFFFVPKQATEVL